MSKNDMGFLDKWESFWGNLVILDGIIPVWMEQLSFLKI